MRSDQEVRALKDALRATSAVGHDSEREPRGIVAAGRWATKEQEQCCRDAEALYESWRKDVQVETMFLEDAELVLTGYGICGRIAANVPEQLALEAMMLALLPRRVRTPRRR